MVSKIVEKVYEKIENGEKLYISINYGTDHLIGSIDPDTINTKGDVIYIEGDGFSFTITNKEGIDISYDDIEEEFIIKHENITYYLS